MESGSGLSFSGLFSNLDTESIITQLMYIERAPVRLLETKQAKLEYEKEDLQEVNSSLLALMNSITSFTSGGIAYDNTVTSEDDSIVTGSANSSASEGTYEIEVLNLAKGNIIQSDLHGGAWQFGGAGGSFDITTDALGGPTYTINVLATDTMSDIATKINTSVSGGDDFTEYGVAELITNPSNGQQTILLKAKDTGLDNRLHVFNGVNNAADVIGFRAPLGGINLLQAAEDSSVSIDGIVVSDTTNLVEGAITGVSLNLQATNIGSPIDLRVGLNNDDIVDKVSSFVSQFNSSTELLSTYVSERPVASPQNESEFKKGLLFGDFDLVSTKSEIRMRTTGYVDAGLADYKLLSQIGIDSEASYGSFVSSSLTFDEDTFRTALADNKDEVISLFEGWADQLETYLEDQTNVSVIESDAGNYYRRMLSIDDRIGQIGTDIDSWEDRLLSMEERMRAEFTAMEEALQQLQTQSTYLSSQLASLTASMSSSK